MEAAEFDSHVRCDRINQMLVQLAKLLDSPEGAFTYHEGVWAAKDAYHRIDYGSVNACAVISADRDWGAAHRFLTGQALDELASNIWPMRNDGRFYDFNRSTWHTAETLAESIYDRISRRVFIEGENLLGFRFQDVTDVSEMTYEGETAYGSLLFLPHRLKSPRTRGITLLRDLGKEDVLFQRSQLKYIRKLLAGTWAPDREEQDRPALVFCQQSIREEYRCTGYVPERDADLFPIKVHIKGNGRWTLALVGRELLEVRDSKVRFLRDPITESREALESELGLCSESGRKRGDPPSFDQYEPFLNVLRQQRHGTSVIFLDLQNDKVSKWISDLEAHGRAQRIKPLSVLKLDNGRAGMLGGISRIDGCFIVDYTKGTLEFINVIVDGLAVVDGSLASGARRNSIPACLATLLKKCADLKTVALLFSEDGDLSVVRGSDLKHQLGLIVCPGCCPARELGL